MKKVKIIKEKPPNKDLDSKIISPLGSLEEALTKEAKLNNKCNPKSGKALLT